MENIPAIKDCNDRSITDSIAKANSLNFCYASVFAGKRNIPQIKPSHSGEPFNTNTKMTGKRLAAIGRNK
jgi:hypothetical protein